MMELPITPAQSGLRAASYCAARSDRVPRKFELIDSKLLAAMFAKLPQRRRCFVFLPAEFAGALAIECARKWYAVCKVLQGGMQRLGAGILQVDEFVEKRAEMRWQAFGARAFKLASAVHG